MVFVFVIAKIFTYMVNICIHKLISNDHSFIWNACFSNQFVGHKLWRQQEFFFDFLFFLVAWILNDLLVWYFQTIRDVFLSMLHTCCKNMRIEFLFEVRKCSKLMALHLGSFDIPKRFIYIRISLANMFWGFACQAYNVLLCDIQVYMCAYVGIYIINNYSIRCI